MINRISIPALATLLLCGPFSFAQTSTAQQSTPAAPATRPANATGICKDGTYSTAASKSGACQGHHGVKEWYAATASTIPAKPATATASTPAFTPTPAAAPSPSTQVRTQSQAAAQSAGQSAVPPATQSIAPPPAPTAPSSATTKKGPKANLANTPVAPGGGPGLVWVNTSSNVYHCPGTDYYGKTKQGSYMSEADAKAKGAHPNRGQACTK